MIINLGADGDITLESPEDLTRFHLAGIRPTGASREALVTQGIELDADDGHAFVDPAAVRGLVERAGLSSAAWQADFEAMVAYATSKGWTDDRGWLRGHTEWS